METSKPKAVVLLSGGQDSTTVFYYALKAYDVVAALTFEYGQRHAIEMSLATLTATKNDVPHILLSVPELGVLAQSSLTNPDIPNAATVEESRRILAKQARNVFAAERGLPPSFTPGRNLLFFTLGAMVCAKEGAAILVTGTCEQDRAGYPDCRAEFLDTMQAAIWAGFDWPAFTIDAPLLDKSKADTWAWADSMGILDAIIYETSSCYEGDSTENEWGRGCGKCGACIEREKGYAMFVLRKGVQESLKTR